MTIDVHLRDRPLQGLIGLVAVAEGGIEWPDRELRNNVVHLNPPSISTTHEQKAQAVRETGSAARYSAGRCDVLPRKCRKPAEITGQNSMKTARPQIDPTRPLDQKIETLPSDSTIALRKLLSAMSPRTSASTSGAKG